MRRRSSKIAYIADAKTSTKLKGVGFSLYLTL